MSFTYTRPIEVKHAIEDLNKRVKNLERWKSESFNKESRIKSMELQTNTMLKRLITLKEEEVLSPRGSLINPNPSNPNPSQVITPEPEVRPLTQTVVTNPTDSANPVVALAPLLIPLGNAVAGLVYPKLVSWLIEPAARRVGSWSKIFSASNEVRQLLFERQRKGADKYDGGLRFEDGPLGIVQATEKLADALFFLYKFQAARKTPETRTEKVEQEKAVKIVEELIALLQTILADLNKKPKETI